MNAITICLTDEALRRLLALAEEMGMKPEDLLQACAEEWLLQPPSDFEKAARYVLRKNEELSQRLA